MSRKNFNPSRSTGQREGHTHAAQHEGDWVYEKLHCTCFSPKFSWGIRFWSQTSLKPLEDTEKDILMLHSKREIELMKNDLAHGLLEIWEVVFNISF